MNHDRKVVVACVDQKCEQVIISLNPWFTLGFQRGVKLILNNNNMFKPTYNLF